MTSIEKTEYAKQICGSVKIVHELLNERSKSCTRNSIATHLPVEITPAQLQVVGLIKKRKQVTMTELASLLGVTVASASAMVDRMVKKDLLIRDIVPQDRRKVIIRLSPTIKKDFNRIEKSILSPICQLVDRIGPETTTMWCDMLNQLKESLVEY